jgi:succinyl-diaminopimelate desuccinylase
LCAILDRHGLSHDIAWTLSAKPFLTGRGALIDAARAAIRAETGLEVELSTSGGTSDGRFIAEICPQILEIGPVNATIHQIDECVEVAALPRLAGIYRRIIEQLLENDDVCDDA